MALAVSVLIALSIQSPAQATGSYAIFYGSRQGLQVGEISALAQDKAGFIWVGTESGLLRFDGEHFLHVAPQGIRGRVRGLWWNDQHGLLIRTAEHHAWVKQADGLHKLIGPNGEPIIALGDAIYDAQNRLWAILGDGLWLHDFDSGWTHISPDKFGAETPLSLWPLTKGIALITDEGAWRFTSSKDAQLIIHQPGLFGIAGGDKRPLFVLDNIGDTLWRLEGGKLKFVHRVYGRPLDIAYRQDTVWVSVDRSLLGVTPAGNILKMDILHGLPSGGPLLVDREGSLWVGTFVGLQQYPSPNTRNWTERDGLPWQHTYSVTASQGQVWVNTWGHIVRFDTTQSPVPMFIGDRVAGLACTGPQGRVWQIFKHQLHFWRNGHYSTFTSPLPKRIGIGGCAPAQGGGLWLATNYGVYHASAKLNRLQLVVAPHTPGGKRLGHLVWQAQDSSLWTIADNLLCHYALSGLQAEQLSCTQQRLGHAVRRVVQIAPHRYWISAETGLFQIDTENQLPKHYKLKQVSPLYQTIEAAPSGGYWAVSFTGLDRITPCAECKSGFRILESIGHWQGVPVNGVRDIAELPSGDLWISGNRGVFHVPAKARPGPTVAPRIVLVKATQDGQLLSLSDTLILAPKNKQLVLNFAALTYRDRTRLSYRFRETDEDGWSEATTVSSLRFIKPEPGHYSIEAQASLDGVHWSAPAKAELSVLPPWYQNWWADTLFVVLLLAASFASFWLWLRHKLSLEKQRIRIAMDLHDELGSTLSSIGVLAGAVAHDRGNTPDRQQMAERITDTSTRLGSALRTVVWTMRQPDTGLRQLLAEIGEQANRLFPNGDTAARIEGRLQANNDAPLAPETCRHVLMVALEALHNAAHYAQASEVVVRLTRVAPNIWKICVQDNGDGFNPESVKSGNGLASMRRRTRLINGELTVRSSLGAGTTVALIFNSLPQGFMEKFHMIMRWRHNGGSATMTSWKQ
ncbi:MAG: histidine kinase [Sinobacteraceae bacterium]|nr:histidine kinase [Nevskiaceae bacterium]